MTQPGQPPQGPIQPGQGPTPTSTYSTTGQPASSSSFPPAQPEPAGRARSGPGWVAYLFTLIAAVIAIAVAVFIAQNTDKTTIDFFGTSKTLSIAGALGIALAAGFQIGLLLGLIPALRAKRQLRQLRRAAR
jgi:uncharacterized integral membrane protein